MSIPAKVATPTAPYGPDQITAAVAALNALIDVLEAGDAGGNTSAPVTEVTYANVPAGTMFVLYRDPTTGAWPAARPSNRTDLTFGWCGVDPSPPIVTSGTGGMLAEVDVRMLR